MLSALDPNWVSAIANCLMACGVFLAWRQILLANAELKADHERSRREKAIELCADWARNVKENTSDAVRIINSLTPADAAHVRNRQSVSIDENLLPIPSRSLPNEIFSPAGGANPVNKYAIRRTTMAHRFPP